MRKQTKLVAVLSAAALLAMGASMTSFAAGWEKDDAGIWHYYDSDDEMVEDEWRKDGSRWFYLDENGDMLTSSWVDDEYYVGEDGSMLKNSWIKTTSDTDIDDPEEDGDHWYYFGSNGKKVNDDSKKINGKTYYFDEDGRMEYGWYANNSGDVFYLGGEDEGGRAENQWLWLEKPGNYLEDDEQEDAANVLGCTDVDSCDDEGWYYFGAGGKMYKDASKKKVNGKYYFFNSHGQMLYEWINNNEYIVTDPVQKPASTSSLVASGANANALDGAYTSSDASRIWNMIYANQVEDGARGDGWYEIDGSEDVGTDNDTDWYYFDNGQVQRADNANTLAAYNVDGNPVYVARIKCDSSKGKKYFAFNELGQMQTGLQYIAKDHGFYYFDDNGYMKTGKVSEVECDDDDFEFYFETKNGHNGEGFSGEKNGYLYFNGKKLTADDDYRLYFFNNDVYLVNSKGKIQTSKSKEYYVENDSISSDDVRVNIGSGDKVTSIQLPGSTTTISAQELINRVGNSGIGTDGKYDDSWVSVPYIELYDNNVFTYELTADNNGDYSATRPEWFDVHGANAGNFSGRY